MDDQVIIVGDTSKYFTDCICSTCSSTYLVLKKLVDETGHILVKEYCKCPNGCYCIANPDR